MYNVNWRFPIQPTTLLEVNWVRGGDPTPEFCLTIQWQGWMYLVISDTKDGSMRFEKFDADAPDYGNDYR